MLDLLVRLAAGAQRVLRHLQLLDDAPEEGAEAVFERVARGTKKFALLAAPWRSASAAAARFLAAFAAFATALSLLPLGLQPPI